MKKLILILLISIVGVGCKKEENNTRTLTVEYSGFSSTGEYVTTIKTQSKTIIETGREKGNKTVSFLVAKGDVITLSVSFFAPGKVNVLLDGQGRGGSTNAVSNEARYDMQPFTVY